MSSSFSYPNFSNFRPRYTYPDPNKEIIKLAGNAISGIKNTGDYSEGKKIGDEALHSIDRYLPNLFLNTPPELRSERLVLTFYTEKAADSPISKQSACGVLLSGLDLIEKSTKNPTLWSPGPHSQVAVALANLGKNALLNVQNNKDGRKIGSIIMEGIRKNTYGNTAERTLARASERVSSSGEYFEGGDYNKSDVIAQKAIFNAIASGINTPVGIALSNIGLKVMHESPEISKIKVGANFLGEISKESKDSRVRILAGMVSKNTRSQKIVDNKIVDIKYYNAWQEEAFKMINNGVHGNVCNVLARFGLNVHGTVDNHNSDLEVGRVVLNTIVAKAGTDPKNKNLQTGKYIAREALRESRQSNNIKDSIAIQHNALKIILGL